ncbi:MAG: hypothetical protein PHS34_08145 [Candidatus Omnitrophica bacterium]|nr:hypothetical protein [Candidatus Nanoarchaeia archaeon]MDD5551214.1 hypothetical protein [Candidatus Omnitrophota bacterium]
MNKPVLIKRGHLLKINDSTVVAQLSLRDVMSAGIDTGKDGTLVRLEVYLEDGTPSIDLEPLEREIIERVNLLKMDRRVEIRINDWYYKQELKDKMVSRYLDKFILDLNDHYLKYIKKSDDTRPMDWPFKPVKDGITYANVKFIKDPLGWMGTKVIWAGTIDY